MQEKRINVLDHGYIEFIDHLGGDDMVVKAARISYESEYDESKNEKLIELLFKLGHESPFEHVVFTFRIKAPIFVARQWMRHRISSINERSGRYTKFNANDVYVPDENRSDGNSSKFKDFYSQAFAVYSELLLTTDKEVARLVLPVSTYTEWYWTINARSLMNFLKLRADSQAQYEIRQYAINIAKIFKEICPLTYKYFIKYSYKGTVLEY